MKLQNNGIEDYGQVTVTTGLDEHGNQIHTLFRKHESGQELIHLTNNMILELYNYAFGPLPNKKPQEEQDA